MGINRIDVYERSKEIGAYVVEKKATVRQAAEIFAVSKSTVHKDITERLCIANRQLALEVRNVLDKNKEERATRGGEATRQKYLQRKRITN